MKYRIVELLKCPDHPESMLRITGVQVSDVFPYPGTLPSPVCRSGCGFLGNWFTEIPDSLPPHHRLDCRRCLGIDIEQGELVCPKCDWRLSITDGILNTGDGGLCVPFKPEVGLKKRAAAQVDKLLSPQRGELVLEFETLPETLVESWCSSGIEQIQVRCNEESIQDSRARSCARGFCTIYQFNGPLRLEFLRREILDAVIVRVPTLDILDFDTSIGNLLSRLKPSGHALLIYKRGKSDRGNLSDRHESILENLPDVFRKFRTSLTEAYGFYFLHVEQPEPVEGFVVHKIDAYRESD